MGIALVPLLALVVAACRSLGGPELEPVSDDASRAFADARAWLRLDQPEDRERARDAARLAAALAPDWVAPRRMLDDLLREDLLGIEALDGHLRALENEPDDGAELYLTGRLEGEAGLERFARAAHVAPELSWAHHGLAFAAEIAGRHREALDHEERALELARDSWERSFFTSALARIEVAADRPKDAIERLRGRLEAAEVAPPDWTLLSVQLAETELGLLFRPEARDGYERALKLLRDHELTDAEVASLAARVRHVSWIDDPARLELQLALASRPGAMRDRLRAELMLEHRPTPLALGLLRRAEEASGRALLSGPLARRARFAAGQFEAGIEAWRRELPSCVLDARGRPRDERLARIVRRGRALDGGGAEALDELGSALIDAGWFREARSVASALAVADLDRALALEARAVAGQQLLQGLDRQMRRLDRAGAPGIDALSDSTFGGAATLEELAQDADIEVEDLQGLLASIGPRVARANEFLGGSRDDTHLAHELATSPLLEYGFVGALVHPGPWFSHADELDGHGVAGQPVPGLARVLDRLGRFGLFGKVLGGGGPDGTVLQRVHVEQRDGRHLGVPWRGTVAWCEGADVPSRAVRQGARISGAALHEGYWIDLDTVRQEWFGWRQLEERFLGEEMELLTAALGTRGLALTAPEDHARARRLERRRTAPLLGAADRLCIAVLADRFAVAADEGGGAVEPGSLVPLDELVEITAIHEEGHLCDRTRFLPIGEKLFRIVSFFVANGLSPKRVSERLEYRAQLIALARAEDPRVPLVEILRAAEIGGRLTPHAAGYGAILEDLLKELDRRLAEAPDDWPELDPDRMLAHQLHRIGPGRLRELAHALCAAEGLVGE